MLINKSKSTEKHLADICDLRSLKNISKIDIDCIFRSLLELRKHCNSLAINVMLIGNSQDIEECLPLLENNEKLKVTAELNLSKASGLNLAIDRLDKVNQKQVDEILICSWEEVKESKKILVKMRYSFVCWRVMGLKELIRHNNTGISHFERIKTSRTAEFITVGIQFLIKRISDAIASSILLITFSLPILVIAILVKLDSPGPIFYRQTRVGLKGTYFKVWKFRTMIQNSSYLQQQLEAVNEIDGGILFKMKKDPRVTRIGRYLRKYSLDELPQLFNVLRGEMSLVGPRPLPIRDVEKFNSEHHFRHEVFPGITGLWQVSGRSNTDSENLFNLDFYYIYNWSLALDFKIMLRTIGVVLWGKGAY